ncbi:oxidoreductase [Planoprotostelium fungivorum]|uniref:Oxidoreductase n=1 Tax=Planoprotostelium fungivorum TaxID=1890364 RepID=A0A2P6MN60_9EUKA|nr:oxidoreductase [Planoprotostelium fungivorum]
MQQQQLPVLICGGGIAGLALAYWLHRGGRHCIIVERSPSLRPSGQNIDIRGLARDVISWMGIDGSVKRSSTMEVGKHMIDQSGRIWGSHPAQPNGFTAELEILRSDLAHILQEVVKDDVKIIYGDYIDDIVEKEDRVTVHFHESKESQDFSVVIGADGVGSKTRSIVFGEEALSAYRPIGLHQGFFSLPSLDMGPWARWLQAPGGRSILARPNGKGGTTVLMGFTTSHGSTNKRAQWKSMEQVKVGLAELYGDVGWEVPKLIEGMMTCDDLYFSEAAQIHLRSWSRGRVVLLGDAAHCPTSMSGMGTSCALVGAYVLASEMCLHPFHPTEAFSEYERVLRPYMEKAQEIKPWQVSLLHPQNMYQIWLGRGLSVLSSYLDLQKYLKREIKPEGIEVKSYEDLWKS